MFQNHTKIIASIGAALLLLSAGATAFFFYLVQEEKAAYREMVVEREIVKTRQASLKKLLETLTETKDDRETLTTRILKDQEVIDFLALVESVGKEQNVTLETESLTVQPINDAFESLVINLSVTGSYASVVHVLKLLEQVPYQSGIQKVTLARDVEREEDSANEWKGTFEIVVTKFKKV